MLISDPVTHGKQNQCLNDRDNIRDNTRLKIQMQSDDFRAKFKLQLASNFTLFPPDRTSTIFFVNDRPFVAFYHDAFVPSSLFLFLFPYPYPYPWISTYYTLTLMMMTTTMMIATRTTAMIIELFGRDIRVAVTKAQ
mmetsp:Transcript_25152/g.37591  ORF Transcript_25152/g.37591 Transcript_25152/m.37591 type:complete len:137 (-) Transcript_25152:492-902(-)